MFCVHPTEEVHPTASSRIELAIKSECNMDQFLDWQNVFKKMGLTRQTKKTLFTNPEKAPNIIWSCNRHRFQSKANGS